MNFRQLLFSGVQQQLFELNETAAILARSLGDENHPRDLAALIATLEGLGFQHTDAADAVRSMLCAWSLAGVVDFDFPQGLSFPIAQQLALGPERVDLHYDGSEAAALVAPSFAHLASEALPARRSWRLAMHEGLILIGREGRRNIALQPRQAAPALKAWLLEDLLHDSDDFTALHAACLVHDGKALLLLGSPGAGKSTLAARLDSAGFGFGGDDLCFLGHDGRVRGVPFALTAKPGAWPLLQPVRPDLPDLPVHLRLDGKLVRYLPPLAPGIDRPMPIGWTILLRRDDDSMTALVERDTAAALTDLLGEAFSGRNRTRLADLHMVLGALGAARSFELRYSSLDEAAAALCRLCKLG